MSDTKPELTTVNNRIIRVIPIMQVIILLFLTVAFLPIRIILHLLGQWAKSEIMKAQIANTIATHIRGYNEESRPPVF